MRAEILKKAEICDEEFSQFASGVFVAGQTEAEVVQAMKFHLGEAEQNYSEIIEKLNQKLSLPEEEKKQEANLSREKQAAQPTQLAETQTKGQEEGKEVEDPSQQKQQEEATLMEAPMMFATGA